MADGTSNTVLTDIGDSETPATDWTAIDGDTVMTNDLTIYRQGTASLKMAVAATADEGDGCTNALASGDQDWTEVAMEFDSGDRQEATVHCLFGGYGGASGQFNCPEGIAVDAGGVVFVAELGDGNGNLLQPKDGHQPGLGAREQLDHHLHHRLGQVQPAVLPGQHPAVQLRLAQRFQGCLGGVGILDLPVMEARPLLISLRGARGDAHRADLAQHLQHQAVVVHCVGIAARRRRGCGRG
jgi:hypothetical protein